MSDNPLGTPPVPPAGWYYDGTGQRWWDGTTWGPYAPPNPHAAHLFSSGHAATNLIGDQGKAAATFAHIGFFILGIWLALILRFSDERNQFVRNHATEALNFQITFTIALFAAILLAIPIAILTVGIGLIILIPLMLAAYVVGAVYSIQGAIAANRMEEYRYPFSYRFVKS